MLISAFCIGAKKLECCGGTKRLWTDGQEKKQILVKWLELKDAGEKNCVNIKHVVVDVESITICGIVSVKFNSWRYKASVFDLLGWTAPRKCRAKTQKPIDSATATAVSRRERKVSGGAAKKACTRKVKNATLFLVSGKPAREKPGDEEASCTCICVT